MNRYNDDKWVGQKFGMLTVLRPVHVELKSGEKAWHWIVKCDCGREKEVRPSEIVNGKNISCGCWRKSGKQVPISHHQSHTRLHNIWCGMNNRCNPENVSARRYGKRGISICEEWSDFKKFAEWAKVSGYKDGLTIERIDVDGIYCPENCKWIPLSKQARNRSTTFWVIYQGRKMSLAEAAELAGLPYKQVHYRIKKMGWTVEKALSKPLKRKSDLHIKCDELGLNYNTVYNRIRMGWSEEDALATPIVGLGANQNTYRK